MTTGQPEVQCCVCHKQTRGAHMIFTLTDVLRWFSGGTKKEKPLFKSEREAYDFCRNAYHKRGGATQELVKAYDFYLKNSGDGCDLEHRHIPG
ncbi:hypothetical protein CCP1ISM_8870001 [Azospirillaceae bacterium]